MTPQEITAMLAQHRKKASEKLAKTLQESRASVIVETDWFAMDEIEKRLKIEKVVEGEEEKK